MNMKDIVKRARELSEGYRVTNGRRFTLKDIDPSDTGTFDREGKSAAREALASGIEALRDLQERLYAQDRWAVLVILQGIDASGKDGLIKHVMSGVNPQGCQVHSFKKPSEEELDHDYLWRCVKALPERGRIGIFNRSYYEEIVIVRVHSEILASQKLPARVTTEKIWNERAEDMRNFEQYLSRNGMAIRKFFLHLSKKEQRRRFLERLDDPDKQWKFSLADVREREHWDAYTAAYEDMIRRTATEYAPWYVVPADHKWYTRIVVAAGIVEAMASLDLRFPALTAARKRELALGRNALRGG